MKKVLFIDRDGTLIVEPPGDRRVDSFAKLRLLPGVLNGLGRIARELDYELVMVTNQDGLGTAAFPERDFFPVHNFLIQLFADEGIEFADVLIDRSFEHDMLPTRKPGTAMLARFTGEGYDLSRSFVIGDRMTDVQLAKNIGAGAICVNGPNSEAADDPFVALTADRWEQIYEFLRLASRRVSLRRATSETDVSVELDLDGRGGHRISTGLPFLDHMLGQFGRHGGVGLTIAAEGDLHVDEHHTIEDVAITLGEAFALALEDKRGVERYGFWVPMDDCLARVVIDFGGRSWTTWDAEFKREMIGKMPTEMFFHFFKSFSDNARCSLNIKAEGTNEHHKIEAIFKAFARAVRMAVKRDSGDATLPSTKGVL